MAITPAAECGACHDNGYVPGTYRLCDCVGGERTDPEGAGGAPGPGSRRGQWGRNPRQKGWPRQGRRRLTAARQACWPTAERTADPRLGGPDRARGGGDLDGG